MVSSLPNSVSSLLDRGFLLEEELDSRYHQPIILPSSRLFGTDGIRGNADELLTDSLTWQIGYWAGHVLKNNAKQQLGYSSNLIIIGQDPRNSSDRLASALTSGLVASGMEVWNLGLCPTPAVASLTKSLGAIGGVMISASHNPPEDNGIKFFDSNGAKLSADLQNQIETMIRNHVQANSPIYNSKVAQFNIKNDIGSIPKNKKFKKHIHRPDLVGEYIIALQKTLPHEVNFRDLKVVLDLAWGASVNVAPSVFSFLGAEVISLHSEPSGDRINVNCGSTHLELLQQKVIDTKADLGFAFDGDADRVMAVDSLGRVVDGDYILYLWGKHLKEAGKLPSDLIVTTVMANLGFERAWEKLGGNMTRTAVGDQYVQAEMRRTGALLGGEQSGHILCPIYSVSGDGVLTALHIAAIVKQSVGSLAELRDESFTPYPQVLRNVRVIDRERRLSWKQCDSLLAVIDQAERAMADQGRVLVRASGTEPVIRVMVEAVSSDLTDYWSGILAEAVSRYLVD